MPNSILRQDRVKKKAKFFAKVRFECLNSAQTRMQLANLCHKSCLRSMNAASENEEHLHLMSTSAPIAATGKRSNSTGETAAQKSNKRLRVAAEAPLPSDWRQKEVIGKYAGRKSYRRQPNNENDDDDDDDEGEEDEDRDHTLEMFSVAQVARKSMANRGYRNQDDDDDGGESNGACSRDDDDDDDNSDGACIRNNENEKEESASLAPCHNKTLQLSAAAKDDPRRAQFEANLSQRQRIAPPRLERVNGATMVRPLDGDVQQRTNREAIGEIVREFHWPPLGERDTDIECYWVLRFLENAFAVRDYADERNIAQSRVHLDRLADEASNGGDASLSESNSDDENLPADLRRTGPGSKRDYRFLYSAYDVARIDAVRVLYDRLGLQRYDADDDNGSRAAQHGNVFDLERIETYISGMISYVLLLKRNLARYVTLFPYQAQQRADEGVIQALYRSVNRDPQFADHSDDNERAEPPRNVNQRLRTLLDRIANMRVAVRALNLIGSTNSRPHGLPIELAAYGLLDSAESMQVVNDDEDVSARQQICSLLLQKCYVNNYRRCNDELFQPKIYNGHNTQAYVPFMSIEEFVWRLPDPVSQRREWLQHTTERSAQRWIVEHLTKVRYESMLPDLVRARDQWSFRNGIYVGHANRFYRYGESYADDSDCPFYTGNISARFFDQEFDERLLTIPASRIETKTVEKIQDSQKWSEDVKGWMWVAFGRLFYDVGQYDDWQFAPYLKGLAGTGKSSLVKMMGKFYDPSMVGTLSNDMETTFGLMSMCDKDLLLAPEIRPCFKLAQASFQTMVSGEAMTIPVKHQGPKSIGRWRTPAAFAGNVFPMWVDSGGSLARRILAFLFDEPIHPSKSITGLEEKLDAELMQVLVKANRFYFAAVAAYGDCNIWNAVPSEFLIFRQSMREETDNVQKFCANATDTSDPEYYVTLEQFIKSMRLMAKSRNWHQMAINDAEVVRSLKQKFAMEKPSNGLVCHRVVKHKAADGTEEYRIYGMRLPREFDITDEHQQF